MQHHIIHSMNFYSASKSWTYISYCQCLYSWWTNHPISYKQVTIYFLMKPSQIYKLRIISGIRAKIQLGDKNASILSYYKLCDFNGTSHGAFYSSLAYVFVKGYFSLVTTVKQHVFFFKQEEGSILFTHIGMECIGMVKDVQYSLLTQLLITNIPCFKRYFLYLQMTFWET